MMRESKAGQSFGLQLLRSTKQNRKTLPGLMATAFPPLLITNPCRLRSLLFIDNMECYLECTSEAAQPNRLKRGGNTCLHWYLGGISRPVGPSAQRLFWMSPM